MLFEGYFQKLCENGHLTHEDVYATESNICPRCGGEFVYTNLVDTTNGSYDNEGNRIDGAKIFKIKKIRTCGHCGSVLEVIYKQPKRKKCQKN